MIDTQSYPRSCFLGLNNTNLWIIKDNNMKTFRKGKIFEAKLISNVSITKNSFPSNWDVSFDTISRISWKGHYGDFIFSKFSLKLVEFNKSLIALKFYKHWVNLNTWLHKYEILQLISFPNILCHWYFEINLISSTSSLKEM